VVGATLLAFQKIIVHWQPICRILKPARLPLAGFQKFSAQIGDICWSTGAKDMNSPVLKSFEENSKSFGTKRLRTY
jgi:hypothetical protein